MLAELKKKDGDEVYKTSLVRLLRGCDDERKWPVLLGLLQRSVAAGPLQRGVGLGRSLDARGARGPAGGHRRLRRGWCGFARRWRWQRCRRESLTDERDRANLEKANRGVHDGHAGPARRLGFARQPRQFLHGRPGLPRGRPRASRRPRSWSRGRSARWSTPRWPTATWARTTRPSRACGGP